jgi:uncharacterized protein YaeQ
MALKSTIFKADVSISDMDRNYYHEHNLTIARHPSENDQRMMLRIIAFILNANEKLEFTKGLSEVEEPDLWQKSFSDEIEVWIELGLPSEQRVKKGCNQSQHMIILSYQDNSFEEWWKKEQHKLRQKSNLSLWTLPENLAEELAQATERNMQIQATVQDGQLWLTINNNPIEVNYQKLI